MGRTTRRRAVRGTAIKTAPVPFWEWTGENEDELRTFCQRGETTSFMSIDAVYARIEFGDATFTAQVYDHLHNRWIPLRTGAMVLRGPKMECWPVDRAVFDETYQIKDGE